MRLPVPEAISVDTSGRRIPGSLLVMSRIPGVPMHSLFDSLDAGERRRITIRIAEDIAELHQATARGFGGVERAETERTDWASFWLPRFDAVMREVSHSGQVEPVFLERIDALRPRLPSILDIGERGTLTHYDIWSGNIMVDVAAGLPRVSGYLDVPGFWADPVRELSFAEMFGIADRLFYEVYTSTHALADGWQLRRDLYNLKMHLKHVTMYPGERYYREGAERCLSSLEAAV
jgi:fructosamine-3-kinase